MHARVAVCYSDFRGAPLQRPGFLGSTCMGRAPLTPPTFIERFLDSFAVNLGKAVAFALVGLVVAAVAAVPTW